MITKKNCGNCVNFLKLKNSTHSICEFHDSLTTSGSPKCEDWKGIKYEYRRKSNGKR
jgi:hypothetical protein